MVSIKLERRLVIEFWTLLHLKFILIFAIIAKMENYTREEGSNRTPEFLSQFKCAMSRSVLDVRFVFCLSGH